MKGVPSALLLITFFIAGHAGAQSWKLYSDSAKMYSDQKKQELAIEYYIKANDRLAIDSNVTTTHVRISNQIGSLYQARGRYDQSEKYYSEAKKIQELVSGKESEDYLRVCTNLNYLYIIMSRYAQAEQLCLETHQAAAKLLGKTNYEYARACRNLGMLYRTLGRFREAESYLLEAQSITANTKGKEKFEYASITNDVGALYILAGFSERAVEQLLVAKEVYIKTAGKESSSYAIVCNNLGLVYKNLVDFSQSEQLYLETKSTWERIQGKRHPSYAQCCYNLGDLYLLIGQYDKAEQLLLEAEAIYRITPGVDHPDYAKVCSKLGKLYYASTNDYAKAEYYLLLSKNIREKRFTKKHPEYAISLGLLGELYRFMGDFGKAEIYYLEAHQISREILGDDHPEISNSAVALALVYIKMKKFDKAEQLLNDVHPAWAQFGVASSSHRLIQELYARLYAGLQNPEKAAEFYKKAIVSQMSQVRRVFQFTSENEKSAFLDDIADSNDEYYSFFGNSRGPATESYDLSLAYRQLILSSFGAVRESIHESGDSILLSKYNDWMKLRKTLASLYSKNSLPDNIRNLEDSANEIEKLLTRHSSLLEKKLKDPSSVSIRQALAADEAAIEFIRYQYFDGANWTDSIYYAGVLLRKDQEPRVVRLFEESELVKALKIYKGTSAEQTQLSYLYLWKDPLSHQSRQTLYELVWKPLEGMLGEVKTIYFSPVGSLFRISFAALPVNEKDLLSDKYRMVQLNTTASLVERPLQVIGESDEFTFYGGINYDNDSTGMKLAAMQSSVSDVATRSLPGDLSRDALPEFTYLLGAEKEINGINLLAENKNHRTNILEGKNATEESFKSLSGKNSPAVLHIATHGFFFPDPTNIKKSRSGGSATVFRQSGHPLMRSGLALAGANNAWKGTPVAGVEDGILTAYEVSNMHLPNTRLAVLSACETGLGDIQGSEGVYGLQRAFKMAGVQNLVMSLWKVPDQETSEFMQQLYKNLFSKQSIEDAFYNAQSLMRTKYRKDPYKWAAWVLIR